jgi:hypothetical protein
MTSEQEVKVMIDHDSFVLLKKCKRNAILGILMNIGGWFGLLFMALLIGSIIGGGIGNLVTAILSIVSIPVSFMFIRDSDRIKAYTNELSRIANDRGVAVPELQQMIKAMQKDVKEAARAVKPVSISYLVMGIVAFLGEINLLGIMLWNKIANGFWIKHAYSSRNGIIINESFDNLDLTEIIVLVLGLVIPLVLGILYLRIYKRQRKQPAMLMKVITLLLIVIALLAMAAMNITAFVR